MIQTRRVVQIKDFTEGKTYSISFNSNNIITQCKFVAFEAENRVLHFENNFGEKFSLSVTPDQIKDGISDVICHG